MALALFEFETADTLMLTESGTRRHASLHVAPLSKRWIRAAPRP